MVAESANPTVEADTDPLMATLKQDYEKLEQDQAEKQAAKDIKAAERAEKKNARAKEAERKAEEKAQREAAKAEKAEKQALVVKAEQAPMLSENEQRELFATAERDLDEFQRGSIKAALAINNVQVYGLFRFAGFQTLEEYGEKRWELSRAQTFKLAQTGRVYRQMQNLLPEGTPLPVNQGQMVELFPLLKLKENAPQALIDTWEPLVKNRGGTDGLTAVDVGDAVDDYLINHGIRQPSDNEPTEPRVKVEIGLPVDLEAALVEFVNADALNAQIGMSERNQAISLLDTGDIGSMLAQIVEASKDTLRNAVIVVPARSVFEIGVQNAIKDLHVREILLVHSIPPTSGEDRALPNGATVLFFGAVQTDDSIETFRKYGVIAGTFS